MTVSVYSVVMSVLYASVIFLVGGLLISHSERVRQELVILIFALGTARLLLPMELWNVIEVDSWNIYPSIRRICRTEVLPGVDVLTVLLSIWIIGILVTVAQYIRDMGKLKEIVANSLSITDDHAYGKLCALAAEQCGYTGKMNVAVTTDFLTAVSVGIREPVILLPLDAMCFPDSEILGIIMHELVHYLRGDVRKQRALKLLNCLFWWNPIAYYLRICMERVIELKCDAQVCANMSEWDKVAYFHGIDNVLKMSKSKKPKEGLAYVKESSADFVLRRYREVMEPKQKHSRGLTMVLAGICVALLLVSYMFVIQPAGYPDEDGFNDLRETTHVEESNEFLIKLPNGTYSYTNSLNTTKILTEEEMKQGHYSDLPIYEEERRH